ncbi:uncharacterized protein DNG_00160 [Cephalotrichum gorgonifer]|uniref:Zn(2)-C6 fungal-type domain-containing protein n=1 Tax=Cephalotrichum gorgonifer TaxID=2041049 RepID=A0AAE8MNG1_9PEZI|nr:uncharacterized protein DNG_00160 [Cephalotrichum gorgonifer]
MVGVPRSTGCGLCVKRRVRCDETRPSCGNCIKYGAECPGYVRALKFVSGKHVRRIAAADPGGSRSQSPQPAPSPAAEVVPSRRLEILPLVDDLISVRNATEFMPFIGLFEGLPDRLGDRGTLDSAVYALALHLRGKEVGDESLVVKARGTYGKSLAALQAALNHPTEWKSSLTLCSAMLLCLYESFAGTTRPDSWKTHASGVGRLMQLRGPESHSSAWDISMISAFRGMIDCFLASDAWRNVWARIRDGDIYSAFVDDFWTCFSLCPRIIRLGRDLRLRTAAQQFVDPAEVFALTVETEELRNRLLRWHQGFSQYIPPPEEVPATDPGALYPTVLTYPTVWIGSLYMGFWASLLILQATLKACQYPGDFPLSNQELVDNILRSVECTSRRLLGPYRVGYSLRIAVEFAGPRERNWIRDRLHQSSASFAATTPTEPQYRDLLIIA